MHTYSSKSFLVKARGEIVRRGTCPGLRAWRKTQGLSSSRTAPTGWGVCKVKNHPPGVQALSFTTALQVSGTPEFPAQMAPNPLLSKKWPRLFMERASRWALTYGLVRPHLHRAPLRVRQWGWEEGGQAIGSQGGAALIPPPSSCAELWGVQESWIRA